jgi:hypothetical protein
MEEFKITSSYLEKIGAALNTPKVGERLQPYR